MSKTTILSTRNVRVYKALNLMIWISILLFLVVFMIIDFKLRMVLWTGYWAFGFYHLYYKRTRLLKNMEYDDYNLYFVEKGQEAQIPFYEVKHIKLRNALGVHSVSFYSDFGFGMEVLFKSSLWYPFNFNKVDDQVYELRKRIDLAKRQAAPSPMTGLSGRSV